MAIGLYTLRNERVLITDPGGYRRTAHLLQLVVRNALCPDAQQTVDQAIAMAYRTWRDAAQLPELMVRVDADGTPHSGSPLFRRQPGRRVYHFEDELLAPVGYLGARTPAGFLLRGEREQAMLDDLATACRIDEGKAEVYSDFWAGKTFRSGAEFLAHRRQRGAARDFRGVDGGRPSAVATARLSKIVSLIRVIESKGERASPADLQFLACLKDKAVRLQGMPRTWQDSAA